MKILQVSLFFKPMWEAGGVVRVVYEISRQLVKNGHDVTVYTTNMALNSTEIKLNSYSNVNGIRVYYFDNLRRIFPLKTIKAIPYFLPFVIRKQIKNFDIIHIHEHRSLLAVVVYLYAKKYHIPYVVQAHGSVLPFYANQRSKRVFDNIIGFNILNNASKLIALNQTEAEQYIKMGMDKDKIEIVPNGVNLEEYQSLPDKGLFRKKYRIKENDKIILYAGRLHGTKGIDLLINSFAEVKRTLNGVILVIVGGGERKLLEDLVKKLGLNGSVIFTGFISLEEKKQAFLNADVFVTPSFTGFPVTFVESCACGTPIITTNKGDTLDWIDNKVGLVTEYNNRQIADAILKILNDDYLMKEFQKNCKRVVLEKFNWNLICKQMEQIYFKTINYFFKGNNRVT